MFGNKNTRKMQIKTENKKYGKYNELNVKRKRRDKNSFEPNISLKSNIKTAQKDIYENCSQVLFLSRIK
jgi:hypothetical protein